MKVLRTALFSAFLMICFTNVGYSQLGNSIHQIDGSGTLTDNSSPIELDADGVAYVLPTDPSYVVVTFEATAPPNSILTIREQGNDAVLFTVNLSDYHYNHAVVQMNVPDAKDKLLNCEVCAEDEDIPCRQQGCILAIDGN